MSKVSGDREELTHARGQGRRPRGATPHPRSVAARRRHPAAEVRGSREKPPRARGQGRQLGGATSCPRAGGREEQPEERWLRRCRRA